MTPLRPTIVRRNTSSLSDERWFRSLHQITAGASSKSGAEHWLWSWVARCASVVQNLTVVFGIFFGIASLLNHQFENRLTRTFEFQKDYNKEIRSMYVDLTTKWTQFALSKGISPSEQTPAKRKAMVLEYATDPDAERRINYVLEFYDALYTCVRYRSCDRNSALELFGRQIDNTYEIFAYFLRERRKIENDLNFGEGLEKLYNMKPESRLERYFF
jgi:hypothetical protein